MHKIYFLGHNLNLHENIQKFIDICWPEDTKQVWFAHRPLTCVKHDPRNIPDLNQALVSELKDEVSDSFSFSEAGKYQTRFCNNSWANDSGTLYSLTTSN